MHHLRRRRCSRCFGSPTSADKSVKDAALLQGKTLLRHFAADPAEGIPADIQLAVCRLNLEDSDARSARWLYVVYVPLGLIVFGRLAT